MHIKIPATLLLLAALSGCNTQPYEPKLAKPPADPGQYRIDIRACRDDSTPGSAELLNSGFATYGGITSTPQMAGGSTVTDHGPRDFFASVDECMKKKGYKLAPENESECTVKK